MIDYAVRIEPIRGGILWFTAIFRRDKERGSLSHAYLLLEINNVPFSLVERGLKLIKAKVEASTGEPARLIHLELAGPMDWCSHMDRAAIRQAQREIEDSRAS